jgi:sulfur carrier protein
LETTGTFLREQSSSREVIAMIKVKVLGRGIEKEVEWRNGMTVKDLLREVGFNTESAIARINGRVVLEDEKIEDGIEVEVIPVVSGG